MSTIENLAGQLMSLKDECEYWRTCFQRKAEEAEQHYETAEHLRGELADAHEALRIVVEHGHPGACDGICADNFRQVARAALAARPGQEQTDA